MPRRLFGLIAASCALALAIQAGALAQCQSCGGSTGPNGADICTVCGAPPVHELSVVPSLFWQDMACCVNDPCFCPVCPELMPAQWYITSEFVPLVYDQSDGGDFQRDLTTGLSVLRESMFDPDFAAGTRLTLGRAIGNWYRLEASYLGSYEWDDTVTVVDSQANGAGGIGNLVSPFSNFGDPATIDGLDLNSLASISFSSQLQSVELNLRRRIRLPYRKLGANYGRYWTSGSVFLNHRAESSFLIGLRYIDLDDDFGYLTASDVPAGGTINQVATQASNNMLGLQFGWTSQLAVQPRGWIETNLLGGIYHNDVDLTSSFITTDAAGEPVSDSLLADSRDHTSWLGELSVTYNYQFCDWLTCRVGYNALAAVDVELGARAMSDNAALIQAGQLQSNADGELILHGPSIGLIGTW